MNLAMAALFLASGLLFLCTNMLMDRFPKPNRLWLGGVLILWAFFRAFTAYNAWQRMKLEEREENRPEDVPFDRDTIIDVNDTISDTDNSTNSSSNKPKP
ncbi:MAG: hypothetical protein ACRCYO_04625 [Bacteroidia bacterium]